MTYIAALAESADGNKNKSTSPPIIYNFKQKIVPLKDGQENVGERIVSLAEPTMARIRCEITLSLVPSYIQVKETAIPLPPPRDNENSSICPKPQYSWLLFTFIIFFINSC